MQHQQDFARRGRFFKIAARLAEPSGDAENNTYFLFSTTLFDGPGARQACLAASNAHSIFIY